MRGHVVRMHFFVHLWFEKVTCGSYAYSRITNIRFNGKLRMKDTEYTGETKRAKHRNLISNNTIPSIHRMCSKSTFIQVHTD